MLLPGKKENTTLHYLNEKSYKYLKLFKKINTDHLWNNITTALNIRDMPMERL